MVFFVPQAARNSFFSESSSAPFPSPLPKSNPLASVALAGGPQVVILDNTGLAHVLTSSLQDYLANVGAVPPSEGSSPTRTLHTIASSPTAPDPHGSVASAPKHGGMESTFLPGRSKPTVVKHAASDPDGAMLTDSYNMAGPVHESIGQQNTKDSKIDPEGLNSDDVKDVGNSNHVPNDNVSVESSIQDVGAGLAADLSAEDELVDCGTEVDQVADASPTVHNDGGLQGAGDDRNSWMRSPCLNGDPINQPQLISCLKDVPSTEFVLVIEEPQDGHSFQVNRMVSLGKASRKRWQKIATVHVVFNCTSQLYFFRRLDLPHYQISTSDLKQGVAGLDPAEGGIPLFRLYGPGSNHANNFVVVQNNIPRPVFDEWFQVDRILQAIGAQPLDGGMQSRTARQRSDLVVDTFYTSGVAWRRDTEGSIVPPLRSNSQTPAFVNAAVAMSRQLAQVTIPWLDADELSFSNNSARAVFHEAIHPSNKVEAARFHESTLYELCGCHCDLQNSSEFPLVIGFNVMIMREGVPQGKPWSVQTEELLTRKRALLPWL